jgi:hypothetical protein
VQEREDWESEISCNERDREWCRERGYKEGKWKEWGRQKGHREWIIYDVLTSYATGSKIL